MSKDFYQLRVKPPLLSLRDVDKVPLGKDQTSEKKTLTFSPKMCYNCIRLVASTHHKMLIQKLAFVDLIEYQERRVMASLDKTDLILKVGVATFGGEGVRLA